MSILSRFFPGSPARPDSGARRLAGALVIALLGLAAATPALADELAVRLDAFRVLVDKAGDERFVPAPEARPGDLLEYRVTAVNQGDRTLRGVRGVLPIPEAMRFVGGSALPAGPEASLDGEAWAAIPLRRPRVLGQPGDPDELVPLSEYRFLRWDFGDLAPGARAAASARITIPLRTAATGR